ncbi:MAG: Ig-like domain-containing protein, partial [Candidatus Aminicenantes bacterium]|nr:Ig-like domain-containing protein [Candidatus Aminicenantes bacterium]
MKKYLLFSGLLVLFCLMLSCKKSPTAPDIPDPTPTPTAVTVTSNNSTIYVGQTEQMTATVTMSNGTTKAATGTWGSDNTNVATVNQSGLVTGIAAGDATIYCDAEGLRGTKKLTVRSLWSRSGVGDMVFDMPTYVSRVRVVGTYTGYSSNFIVHVGGRLLVNELLGTGWGTTRYDGTLLTTGGVVEIKYSSGVLWSFTQVLAPNAT